MRKLYCKECGAVLMPLQEKGATCPGGHGKVQINIPKIALDWAADQAARGRRILPLYDFTPTLIESKWVAEGLDGEYRKHRILREDGKHWCVLRVGDDLPDGCQIGLDGEIVKMFCPAKPKEKKSEQGKSEGAIGTDAEVVRNIEVSTT